MLTDFDLSRLLPPRHAAVSRSPSPPPASRAHNNRRTRVSAVGLGQTTTSSSKPPEAPGSTPRQHFQSLVRYLMRRDGLGRVKRAKSTRVSPVGRTKPASFGGCSAATAGAWGKSYSFVGTEEYVAPEMVRGEGHGFTVDWWALGVLVYEMAFGQSPFKGRNRKETFRKVLLREVEFPGDSTRRMPELTDLVARLLEEDPPRRLGFAGGAEEIKAHPFFAGVAWDMLTELSRPPYIPPLADEDAATTGEGFDVRDLFKNVHHPPRPEATGTTQSSPDFSIEF
jgi:protein-serine/threonine kinase